MDIILGRRRKKKLLSEKRSEQRAKRKQQKKAQRDAEKIKQAATKLFNALDAPDIKTRDKAQKSMEMLKKVSKENSVRGRRAAAILKYIQGLSATEQGDRIMGWYK